MEHDRHLVAYYGLPAIGAALHTINQRMQTEHIVYSVNQAEDEVLLVEADSLPVTREIVPATSAVKHVVVLGDGEVDIPGVRAWSFDDLVDQAPEPDGFGEFDERTASSICFTSGTTGKPKGVVYTHRSTVLHAMALSAAGAVGVSHEHSYLVACQMSHVNSRGVPHPLQGARLVLPGAHPTPADYLRLITDQEPDVIVGAPAVMALLRDELAARPNADDVWSLRTLWMGGQAPLATANGWGMTETSPMATFCDGPEDQGPQLPLSEIRVVDDAGAELAWSGRTTGELEARAPWVTAATSGTRALGLVPRRLDAHRRRRGHWHRRSPGDQGPAQGPDQERRRGDLVDRAREPPGAAPRDARGRGHQGSPREVAGAARGLDRARR